MIINELKLMTANTASILFHDTSGPAKQISSKISRHRKLPDCKPEN